MEPSVVVIGMSRQPVFWGLPLPYFLAVGALTMFPFILFKLLSWLLTAPAWYMAARIVTAINPNIHTVASVRLRRTPMSLLRFGKAGRYV